MALSQIQCLDDKNINPRTHEAKPEFLYCEDQRLALEALLRDGREAFAKYLESRGLRGFLSDSELESLAGGVEPFDPGSELMPDNVTDDPTPLSLHYWPELSDTSIPQMDLGWPDSSSYRGVTRATVYTQPPLDGQGHIKEVVRKMIAQAQKVIAVAMDVFTDVDIFRDLLEAGFRRRVSVYILLERATLPHFLSMCQRASMHAGHLKYLRVRCSEGAQFHTRHCTKVRGRMGHRFMFLDGDKAVSGSYSFTWMSSRLDRHLMTVITGQGVDPFDQLFRFLYMTSEFVDLKQVATELEPEPELRPQLAPVAPPSADVARKLYNPKYALVALSNPSPTNSAAQESPKGPATSHNSKKQKRAREEATQDAPPLHPGLINLEKVYLISYLPTWPEPDPPSDVIGFINIRDTSKPTQVHLQRSEMFETSQAIRFSSPISKPQVSLPEVATPRRLTVECEEVDKLQLSQSKSEAVESVVDRAKLAQNDAGHGDIGGRDKTPKQKSPPCSKKSEPGKDKANALKTEIKLISNTVSNPETGNGKLSHLSAHETTQSSCRESAPNNCRPSQKAQTTSFENVESDSVAESNAKKEDETGTSLKKKRAVVCDATDLNPEDTIEKPSVAHTDSNANAINRIPQMTHNLQTPNVHEHSSPSSASTLQFECSTFLSKNNLITTVHSSTASSSCTSAPSSSSHSSFPSPTSTFTSPNPPSPSSTSSCSGPPIPKQSTVKTGLKDSSISDAHKLPEISVVRSPNASTGPQALQMSAPLVKRPESAPDLRPSSARKAGDHKDTENTYNPQVTPQQRKGRTSLERSKGADGQCEGRTGAPSVTGIKLQTQSDALITDAPKPAFCDALKMSQEDVDSKTSTSTNSGTDCVFLAEPDIKASEFSGVPNMTQCQADLPKVNEPQRTSYRKLTSQDVGVLGTVDSSEAPVHCMDTFVADAQVIKPAHCTDSPKQSTHTVLKGRTHTPVKALTLQLSAKQSPSPERGLTQEESPSHPSSSGSGTTSPVPRLRTPDVQTPTPDSDGYISPRQDSTTSEEYYECSDSPFPEPVLDQSAYQNHGEEENLISLPHWSMPKDGSAGSNPAYLTYSLGAATLSSTEQYSSNSETSSRTSVVSSSSLIGTKGHSREPEDPNEENEKPEDIKPEDLSHAGKKKKEQESQGIEGASSDWAGGMVVHFEQDDSIETALKGQEVQAAQTKRGQNHPAPQREADRGATAGKSTRQETEQRQSLTEGLKPTIVASEGEKKEKTSSGGEKAWNEGALRPGDEESNKSQSHRETKAQKSTHTSPKPHPAHEQNSGSSSSSRPQKPRLLSASQASPSGSRELNPTDNKTLPGSPKLTDNFSSARRQPRPASTVPAGAVGSAAGRRQVSQSQQTIPARQPPAPQMRAKTSQPQSQTPQQKPPASFLYTHAKLQSSLPPNPTVDMVPAQEAQAQVSAPFSLTFGRLHSFKSKKSKTPVQGKRGSSSPPVKGRKSTS
ncbi:unnamed protein product [Menidia menidia]|uniref:(Atlantic silverside) hypothetical protein n=1 Tax=Menidia menidia TaxID=238744 RepID=A0A8S4AXZ8_9TELE|nr:unnamed protein product [Menidia menidia]